MGRHSKTTSGGWVGPGRVVALAGVLGAGVLGATTGPLTGSAAGSAPTPTPTAHAATAPTAPTGDAAALVPGTPCTATAKACVDLAHNQAWLIQNGQVTRGPVPITQGADGEATPAGTFAVQWKDLHHRSAEYNNAPMEYSLFFAPGGIAFHQGSLRKQSAGCVHLSAADAAAWYDYLQVGDQVQVH